MTSATSAGAQGSSAKRAPDATAKAYALHCASCHGEGLGGRFGPPLKGSAFVAKWGKKPVNVLADYLRQSMPPANPNSLPAATYTALARYLRTANGVADAAPTKQPAKPQVAQAAKAKPSAKAQPAAQAAGKTQPAPKSPSTQAEKDEAAKAGAKKVESGGLAVTPMENDPFVRAHAERLSKLTAGLQPVSDAMLNAPAAADWPTWRRSHALTGYAPLDQINPANVSKLGVAWALGLKPGTNGFEPLVQDGILFINSGDAVQALDGQSGDVIWEYKRVAAAVPIPLSQSRGMTLYNGRLYVPTLDTHVIALDARTGKLVWDHALSEGPDKSFIMTGAPLAVNGKIIQGVSGCFGQTNPGGCFIVALDANDGREVWRFNTIARPGQPGGNSWNGAPLQGRFGGSVWTGGSYDPDTKLAYFGVGQTYMISTLLAETPASAGSTRDALYTDATLALDPDTGKLVWHYQHMAGDVWDLDWAFERTLMTLPGKDGPRKVVVTAGKIGIVDVLDARTGQYISSADLGVQTLVTKIDPVTGSKTPDPKLVPVRGEMRTICPSSLGGRNWLASSIDPQRNLIFFPLSEACMELGIEDNTLGDMKLVTRTNPTTDGKLGRVAALDLAQNKILWFDRMRAPPASAVLTTSGGIVFEGGRDRWFRARAADTGKVLWQTRLDDTPNGFPISYAVGGRQYVAVVTGANTPYDYGLRGLTPEIRSTTGGRTLWIFALPEMPETAR